MNPHEPNPSRDHLSRVLERRDHFFAVDPPASADGVPTDHRGWHSRGYLPHFDHNTGVQSVTFRLADSLPIAVQQQLLATEDPIRRRQLMDRCLDQSHGACWLSHPEIAALVEGALLHFDGERYRLCAWCLMPNHVHVVFEPHGITLSAIVGGWKSYTARVANRMLHRTGTFWQEDYWDRWVRDEEHLRQVVRYVEANPVKARLTITSDPREWRWSSARLRDVYARLPKPDPKKQE